LGLAGSYPVREICALIHARGAEVMAVYEDDFYAGRPAMTVNRFGKGEAYYIAGRSDSEMLGDFYAKLATRLHLARGLELRQVEGVSVQVRSDGKQRFVFVMNFTTQ